MFRVISFFSSILLFFWWSLSFSITDISLDYEEAKTLWWAVFVIEKVIDTHELPRDRVVEIIQQFGTQKWLTTDPRFLALLTMIDFHNRGAKLSTTGELHYHEYIWWIQFSALTHEEQFWIWFMCPDGKFMSDEAKEKCYTTDVLVLEEQKIIEPQEFLTNDRDKFRLSSSRYVAWCIWSGNTVLTKTRRYLWDTTYVRHQRNTEILRSSEPITFIAQILPLREWNYGSTGPDGFACQSVFNRIEVKSIE